MVVVVQFFTTNQNPDRRNIAGVVRALKITVAHPVTNTVYNTGSPEGNPGHLHRPDPDPVHPEERQINHCHQHNAQHSVAAVQVALNPVFRGALAVTLKRFRRGRRGVEFCAFKQHFLYS